MSIEVFLVSRFCIDFFGTNTENSLFKIVINLSNFLLKPFSNTFNPSMVDGSTLDYSTLYAIAIYALSGIAIFKLFKILLKSELRKKSLELISLLFLSLEGITILRILSEICKAQYSPFNRFVHGFSNLFIKPLSLLTPITGEMTNVIAAVAAMILLGVLWFTSYKILEGLSASASKLEQPNQPQLDYTPPKPEESLENVKDKERELKIYKADGTEGGSIQPEASQTTTPQATESMPQASPPQDIQPAEEKHKEQPKIIDSLKKMKSKLIKDEPNPTFKQTERKTTNDSASRKSPLA